MSGFRPPVAGKRGHSTIQRVLWRVLHRDWPIDAATGWLLGFAPTVFLALSGGGYDIVVRSEVGIVVWWVVLLGAIVGVFMLNQIVRRLFQSAYMGYYAERPFTRQGYMTEGLQLVLRHTFMTMRLHRVEANIQPENVASIALVKRAGFRLEGFSPRYLKISGRWRDHQRWAMTIDDWQRLRRRPRAPSAGRGPQSPRVSSSPGRRHSG